jgi:hypothetical protein
MSPSIHATARRFAALRSTDGSAQRTAVITAQSGIPTQAAHFFYNFFSPGRFAG